MPQRSTITGFSNPTVKFLRSLRDKKHRKAEQCFLAEGLQRNAQQPLARGVCDI